MTDRLSHDFDSEAFAAAYHYDGDDLGATPVGDRTTFKVWAPTASRVVLNLFAEGYGGDAYRRVDMTLAERGVWTHTEPCGSGTYYTYSVTTAIGTHEAVDPYARSAGLNGRRGMVIDLVSTDPEGFRGPSAVRPLQSYTEAIIWEVHIRDFSGKLASSKYRGKYLAFTEGGLVNEHGESVGLDYLKQLGVTHVHLLPLFDYASVDEAYADTFNWGYDPLNYNVPEGSYATDPYRGEVRVRECKQMIAALHEAGIGVIMDMVYNHTYRADSSFHKLVPYYYYRYTADGKNTSASGCGNDTASERYMFGKFMADSAAYWVREYRLDGLRFDLMGLHDLAAMQRVEAAVHAVNPHAILYGEGWVMGATVDGSKQANQYEIHEIRPTGNAVGGIAVFNDVIRDGLKGSVFHREGRGYINGAPWDNLGRVIFGLGGGSGEGFGWRVERGEVINYMSAHDNLTLWDKLSFSCAGAEEWRRVKMNKLGAAILMLAKGTPFFQAGEELLRTKDGDENSYRSTDEVNNLDWSTLQSGTPAYETMCYYRGLIRMRRALPVLTDPHADVDCAVAQNGVTAVWIAGRGERVLALLNPHAEPLTYVLSEPYLLVADGTRAGDTPLAEESGPVTVDGHSVRIYKSKI